MFSVANTNGVTAPTTMSTSCASSRRILLFLASKFEGYHEGKRNQRSECTAKLFQKCSNTVIIEQMQRRKKETEQQYTVPFIKEEEGRTDICKNKVKNNTEFASLLLNSQCYLNLLDLNYEWK